MDNLSIEMRSKIMSSIRGKNTKPEMLVRSILHRMGFRFRLHNKDLPGRPDICLKKYKTVIFVNGCFWHRHRNCKIATVPRSNIDFWNAKFERTLKRDKENLKALKKAGWKVIVVWECSLKDLDQLAIDLKKELAMGAKT